MYVTESDVYTDFSMNFLLSQAAHECLAQMITEVDKLFSVSRISLIFKFYQQFFSGSTALYFLSLSEGKLKLK